MESLSELISRVLAMRGETVSAFAARIGVNRLTVNRWKQSLPSPETLRRVADDLDVPYSQVLAAAMASAGYVTSPRDLLAGHEVHVVTYVVDDEDDPDDQWTATAFVSAERATAFVQAMSAGPGEFHYWQAAAVLDGTEIPETVEVFTTTWSSRTDQIRQHSALAWPTPARLIDREVTPVEATALAETGEVFLLRADSLDAEAGRTAVASALDVLRQQGRLYPTGSDPVPALDGAARYLESLRDRYSQARGAPSKTGPAEMLQVVPPGFAAARQSEAIGSEAVWPQTRRFVAPSGTNQTGTAPAGELM
ncbi:helix-turn-helix domain-containing protein [Mycolicibacterium goodii]|uniref:helix-turn-helix domain-containing protein n=1 Tax=Mycolicibacterium goodii TaxID=134601 RepID=UPI001BDBB21D|nr:helix-turn-helix transcriptional regulator [Mycolicibacterium goodii]MBU8820742.1 helix-turn-helix domain-containing protein [Mycolicibacterium goodii]